MKSAIKVLKISHIHRNLYYPFFPRAKHNNDKMTRKISKTKALQISIT